MAKNALTQILFFLGHDLTIQHDIMVLFLKTRDKPSFYSPFSCQTFFPFLLQLSRTLTANKQLFCLLLPLFVTQFSSTPPPIALFSLLLGGPTLRRPSIVELLLIAIPFHCKRDIPACIHLLIHLWNVFFDFYILWRNSLIQTMVFFFFCRHTDLSFSPGEVRLVDPKSIPTYKQPTLATFKCLNPPSCTWNLKYDCPMCQYAIGVNTAENLLVLHALWQCSSWAWCYPVNALYLKC